MAYDPKFEKQWLRVWLVCARNCSLILSRARRYICVQTSKLAVVSNCRLVNTSSSFSVSEVTGIRKRSLLSNTKVYNEWNCISLSPLRDRGVYRVNLNNFFVIFYW
jgi:hypothetical protein